MDAQEVNIISFWNDFSDDRSLASRHRLILHYIWLVKYVVQTMNLPMNSLLSEQDFINIGILGLHEAIDRFELDRGVKFESYAIPRIKGTIQDELRRLDWLSRSARKKAHEYLVASDYLRSHEGREVSAEEIRKKLNVTLEEYESYLSAAAAAKVSFTINDTVNTASDEDVKETLDELPDTSYTNTLDQLENEERVGFLMNFLKNLNERKRLIITLYYYEDLTFKEIGQLLNISESRVCQIHTQILTNMRQKLNEFDNA